MSIASPHYIRKETERMKKLCSLLLALTMLLSLIVIPASAAGSDIVLPKSPDHPGLTVTLTGVLSTKNVKVLNSYFDDQYEVAYREELITVYQLPLTGAEVKFSGKLEGDLFPGGYGGFSLIDGKYQRAEIGSEGQWWYIGAAGESREITDAAGDTNIQILHICEGVDINFTFADLSAYAEKPENPFTDISKSDAYYDAVIWALKNNVTKGISETSFGPAATCTRGQVATFLWRAAGCPEPKTTVNPFTDVKEGSAFYKAILWAYENGITNGNTPTTFNPGGKCTSGHVVTFLWRAQGKPAANGSSELGNKYYGKYYSDAVCWADRCGLLAGTDFNPDAQSPRSEIVLYLCRHHGNGNGNGNGAQHHHGQH